MVADPDTETLVMERIALCTKNGAGCALSRIATAVSERTKETVAATLLNMCKHHPARGLLAQQGAIGACCRCLPAVVVADAPSPCPLSRSCLRPLPPRSDARTESRWRPSFDPLHLTVPSRGCSP